jgi:glycosyltransferase involved in cell wall biosynthesis
MACRVPVLASSVCGTPEAVVDGRTGRLIPSGETRALASALEELLWDRETLAELASAGRNSAELNFTLDRMVRETALLYEELRRPP